MAVRPLSVSQLNKYISRVVKSDSLLSYVPVIGEVEDFKRNSKGYINFTLKDNESSIRCYINSNTASMLRFDIENGMELIVYGSVTLYEKACTLSIDVNSVEPGGEGTLAAAFRILKEKLEKEGLFDAAHKKKIPAFPRKIGVVTSPTGSAIHDIVDTTRRRNPLVDIIIFPSLVQGDGSAASVCEGIRILNEKFPEIDVIIIGRGGGSTEDLWTFNEESVARAVYASKIPVISAVGHHDNHVISDEVADLAAGTPTAAAELAVPDISAMISRLNNCSPQAVYSVLASRTEMLMSGILRLRDSANNLIFAEVSDLNARLRNIKINLDSLYPLDVLKKGYAAVQNMSGRWVTSAADVSENEDLIIKFSDGQVFTKATKVVINEER